MRIVRGFETCVVGRVFGPHESRRSLQLARIETNSQNVQINRSSILPSAFDFDSPTRRVQGGAIAIL